MFSIEVIFEVRFMQNLYICNVSSNYISRVRLDICKEEKMYISMDEKLLGSHGLDLNKGKLYVATNDNYNFYEIDIGNGKVEDYYTGMPTNDLKFKDNYMYLICSESNCMIVYDMVNKGLCYEIECGNYPHSMDICDKSKLICITNMHNNQLTMVNYQKNDFVRSIRTGNLPMKSKFHKDGRHIFVCESNLGDEESGTFSIYDSKTGERHKTITLGKSPIDMYFDYDDNTVLVSNYLGNCISVVDLTTFEEISRIDVCGTPRGISKIGRFLYVVISDKDTLLKYDIYTKGEEFIKTGLDPTCIYSS